MSLRELSLHILDIAENSVQAGAKNITIRIHENERTDRLSIGVIDDGKGMDSTTLKEVTNPFITSRTTRKVGLGIPFLKAAAESCNGAFHIQSILGTGTKVEAEFQRSHIDRMPMGDLTGTLITLIIGYPEVNWQLDYSWNENTYHFDDKPVKEILEGVPLSSPEIIKYMRETISHGINTAQMGKIIN